MSKDLNINAAICQINPTLGDFENNFNKLLDFYQKSLKQNADIVIFPEMSTTGYPPQDLLFSEKFIQKNLKVLKEFSKKVTKPCILGFVNKEEDNLYNAAAVCENGKIVKIYHKIHLPNYDVFDERRYFKSGDEVGLIDLDIKGKNLKIALQICEDLWEDSYDRKISSEIIQSKPDIIVNISASPFRKNRESDRFDLISKKYCKANSFFIYCNLVGGQDELIFDGNSMIFEPGVKLLNRGCSFKEDILVHPLNCGTAPSSMENFLEEQSMARREETWSDNENQNLFNALSLGIRDYFHKTAHKSAVIGLSGGIDSALVACLAVDALGSDNVTLISMPSRFSSEHSKTDASKLAKSLNTNFKSIDIDGLFQAYLDIMDNHFKGLPPNVAEENIQSRIRGNILMAFSNKLGSLVLSTGNKTELALGYCTLYGDMSGGLSAIGDLNKTEVYNLSKWINQDKIKTVNGQIEILELIPENIIKKEPSAELAANQVDPFDYDLISPLVDKIIFGDEYEENEQFLNLNKKININEHKRRQAAPVLRVSKKAFGIGRRIPIVNHFHE